MGKILKAEEITRNNITTFLQNATQDYSIFLKSAPTFVTYYSKNSFLSTYDKSFEAVTEIIGADSPIKFNEIKSFPLYAVQNASFGTDIGDFGISADVSSNATILPRTIVPAVDDYFTLFYNNELRVFQISDVEVDNYNNDKYYKISFFLSSSNILELQTQVSQKLHTDYSKIGKVERPFSEENVYNAYSNLEDIYDSLLKNYNDIYYDTDITFYVDAQEHFLKECRVYDIYLNHFIVENELNSSNSEYRSFNYVHKEILKDVVRSKYRKTIFYKMDSSAANLANNVTLNKVLISRDGNQKYSNTWRFRRNYYTVSLHDSSFVVDPITAALDPTEAITYNVIPDTLLDAITNNTLDYIGTPYEKIVINYFNGKYDTSTGLFELVDDLNVLEDYASNYYIIPLCLFIIKNRINKAVNNL